MSITLDRILYEDDYLLAVHKLSGELVVKGKGKLGKLPLLDFLKKDFPGLKAVHRLDLETSGVVVFAKNASVECKILDTKFDQWEKKYHALVMGRIGRERGVIRKKLPVRSGGLGVGGRGLVDAETRYVVLDRFGNSSFVECMITTGRYHQIRKHFASIGHPLVLDRVYGDAKFNQLFRQEIGYSKFFLHASETSFPHPVTGEKIVIRAPMPKTFQSCLDKLKVLSR